MGLHRNPKTTRISRMPRVGTQSIRGIRSGRSMSGFHHRHRLGTWPPMLRCAARRRPRGSTPSPATSTRSSRITPPTSARFRAARCGWPCITPERPPLVDAMVRLAREELEHFTRVYDVLVARGRTLAQDAPDPYMSALRRLMRKRDIEEYLVDRLIVFGVVEARACERFQLLGRALDDAGAARILPPAARAEARHHGRFLRLAHRYAACAGAGAPRRQCSTPKARSSPRCRSGPRCTDALRRSDRVAALQSSARRVLGLFPIRTTKLRRGWLAGAVCRRGADVQLLTATRGEAGTDRRGMRRPGHELAAWRSGELAGSCAALGIAPPAFAELPDGGSAMPTGRRQSRCCRRAHRAARPR